MRQSRLGLLALILLPSVLHAVTIDITTCPARVPKGAVGVLQADLDCVALESNRLIVVESGATLDLNGHTLTYGAPRGITSLVSCEDRCTVKGPGTLTASGSYAAGPVPHAAINGAGRAHVTVEGVAIDTAGHGIVSVDGKVTLRNTTIDAYQFGVVGPARILLDTVFATVTIPGGDCIGATADARKSTVRGRDVVLGNCFYGISASKNITLERLTATGVHNVAVIANRSIRLRDSVVTGSGIADVVSGKHPMLINTTCDKSISLTEGGAGFGPPWGVCAND